MRKVNARVWGPGAWGLPLPLGVLLAGALVGALACGEPGGDAGEAGQPGASESYEPLVTFDTTAVEILAGDDTVRVTAELANDGDRRSYGMMERPSLPAEHGMLFVYPETLEPTGAFWMYRTRVALDIAFLDAEGRIVSILAMDPCTSPNPELCRRYSPGVAYRGALEMGQGFFARRGVEVGDRVVPAPGDVPAAP